MKLSAFYTILLASLAVLDTCNSQSEGVYINPDVQSEFNKLLESKLRYIIYKIVDKEILVETSVSQEELAISGDDYEDNSKAAYEAFIKDLKERTDDFKDARYGVFNFKFSIQRSGSDETSKMDKNVFIQLTPDGAPIKKKMLYATSASAIKASLGTQRILHFQVSDESELAHQELLNKLREKYADN